MTRDAKWSERFLRHLEQDLLPFWCSPEALGTPVGNAPSFRHDNGTLMSDAEIRAAMQQQPAFIRDHAHQEFTRTRSRNLFGLGAMFHLTGRSELLRNMHDSVAFLRQRVLRGDGHFVTAWDRATGADDPTPPNSQEYALLLQGLGFYYFLTRDTETLGDIRALFRHVQAAYRCPYDPFLLTWSAATVGEGWRDLRSVLDHLNSYMFLLSPVLPLEFALELDAHFLDASRGGHRRRRSDAFATQIRGHIDAMRRHFYDDATGMFRLRTYVDRPDPSAHTDCGHTAKAFWMIYFAGHRLRDEELLGFGRAGIERLVGRAFMPQHGGWCINFWPDGRPIEEFEWWSYAILDQAVASLAIEDPALLPTLHTCYRTWFDRIVDHHSGEVFHNVRDLVSGATRYPKVHLWKDAYHTCEHALVGYLTSDPRVPKRVYFAIDDTAHADVMYPYVYAGRMLSLTQHRSSVGTIQETHFEGIRC